MDWTTQSEMTKAQIMRIVALLFALGLLAERACGAPLAVRLRVMGFLGPAEQVAWDFITGQVPELAREGGDPASAMRLAARFRALAIMLAMLAERFGRRVRPGAPPPAVAAAGIFPPMDGCGTQPFDTS